MRRPRADGRARRAARLRAFSVSASETSCLAPPAARAGSTSRATPLAGVTMAGRLLKVRGSTVESASFGLAGAGAAGLRPARSARELRPLRVRDAAILTPLSHGQRPRAARRAAMSHADPTRPRASFDPSDWLRERRCERARLDGNRHAALARAMFTERTAAGCGARRLSGSPVS